MGTHHAQVTTTVPCFVESPTHIILHSLFSSVRSGHREALSTDQVGDQVTDQVAALIRAIGTGELGSNDLMQALGLSHRPTFRNNTLNPALENEWIERTQPYSPRSPTQRYRLTGKGQSWLLHHADAKKGYNV